MKMLLKKMLTVARRESTAVSRSTEFVPSQSSKNISTGKDSSPTSTVRSIGFDQIQIPLVQARVVEPTSKPFTLCSNWLAKKDLPDLYGPQIVTGAILVTK